MPAKPPAYAIQLQGKLMALGEKVLESLATDAVKQALSAAALALWAAYADQTLLWQIYSRRCPLQIHFRQCGHRCGGSRAMSSRMA